MPSLSLSDLPPKYQDQAVRQLQAQMRRKAEAERVPKYRNQKTERKGISFDSKKEARRFEELMLMLQAGEISDLRLQQDFTLQEAYTTPDGERVRAIRYRADFTYQKNGEYIVEDVKSKATRTRVYLMKKKMMLERLGIRIREV